MMRASVILLLAALPAACAVIRGTVVENFTNKVLARALVVLEPMPGTPGEVRTMRTTRLGAFEFEQLPGGYYVLKASRRGYLPAQYGQKRWNSAGQPVAIEESASAYLPIRLARYSAIGGTIVDENDIGLPGHEVAVYRVAQPPEFIRSAAADDRGVYRVSGLEAGRYLVRSIAKQYEEGGYLPTFSRETLSPDQAQLVDVLPEQQTDSIDVRPLPGRLFDLTVGVGPEDDPETVLTLASGMGRVTVKGGAHHFTGLSPGEYEIYAEAPGRAAYERIFLNNRTERALKWVPSSRVNVTGGPAGGGKLRIRRRDLAGPGPESTVEIADAIVPVGRWELLFDPPDGYYVSSVFPPRQGRLDGWLEFTGRPYLNPTFRLASGAASIRGTIKDAPYALVYLEGYDSLLRKRVAELKVARADARGNYRFANLAPGDYRLLSTFEYLNPSTEVFDSAAPVSVSVERNADIAKDLELWIIR